MSNTAIKAKWAAKLLRSKHFLVVTDEEAVIFVENTDASKFEGAVTALAHLTSLRKFQRALNGAVAKFAADVEKQYGAKGKKGAKKIKVTVK